MKKLIYGFLLFSLSVLSVLGREGTLPRGKASDYPCFTEAEGAQIGAALLTDTEIRQHFVSNLGRRFLVVEVALYPQEDTSLEVTPDRFLLRPVGKEIAMPPENPRVIAGALRQKNSGAKRDIQVAPQVGVGYESGRPTYDPSQGPYDRGTGNAPYDTRGRGVYTSTGVGVLLGGANPGGSFPEDNRSAEIELAEKELPRMTTGRSVAGHLYFLADKAMQKDKKARYQLECEIAGKKVTLLLAR